MSLIAVTGGSGAAGQVIIEDLHANDYKCINIDRRAPTIDRCQFEPTDMTDYPSLFKAMEGADALVHFAGNPHPDDEHYGAAVSFNNNTMCLFNAFNAARALGIKRVVWASSETVYGYPFVNNVPVEVPITEETLLQPQNGYALSKVMSENLARRMHDLYSIDFIGLRISNIHYDDEDVHFSMHKIHTYSNDIPHRKFNLWGYVDARDVAKAVRLALERKIKGAHVFNIAAQDTVMKQRSRDLLKAIFPHLALPADYADRGAFLSCEKAKLELGFVPQYSWFDLYS